MAQDLGRVIHQLGLLHVEREAGSGQPPDSLLGVQQHLVCIIPEDSDVIEVDNDGQGAIAGLPLEDRLHDELEVGWGLRQPHWHPQPPELAPVGDEGTVVAGDLLEGDIMEARLEVQHRHPLCPPQHGPIPAGVI